MAVPKKVGSLKTRSGFTPGGRAYTSQKDPYSGNRITAVQGGGKVHNKVTDPKGKTVKTQNSVTPSGWVTGATKKVKKGPTKPLKKN